MAMSRQKQAQVAAKTKAPKKALEAINFRFTVQEADIIVKALAEIPFKFAQPILAKIEQQANDKAMQGLPPDASGGE